MGSVRTSSTEVLAVCGCWAGQGLDVPWRAVLAGLVVPGVVHGGIPDHRLPELATSSSSGSSPLLPATNGANVVQTQEAKSKNVKSDTLFGHVYV